MRVALDIGHMGKRNRPLDRGATSGESTGYIESSLALDYAVVSRKLLENSGHDVILLSYDNYSKRHDYCKDMNVDLHMQCHVNSPDGRYALVMCRADASESCLTLTEIMSHQFKKWLGKVISKVEVKKIKGDDRGYGCLMAEIPSLILEPLFIRNEAHLKYMLYEDGITMIGHAIADSVNEWSQTVG
jgi:N-acetylmuramoyl-L-alanine amidase